MAYTLQDLAWIMQKLQEHGINGVIIGSTVVELALRKKTFVDDIDVFALEPSPLIEEDHYSSVAASEGWGYSYTVVGTPKFIVRAPSSGEDVVVEFYENVMDFDVPNEMLARATTKKIGGVSIRLIKLEDYIVLKAKAARETDVEDLRIIKEYIDSGKLSIDKRLVKQALEWLPEEYRAIARSKLAETGILVL